MSADVTPESAALAAALLDSLQEDGHLTAAWRPTFERTPREHFLPNRFWVDMGAQYGELCRDLDTASWTSVVYGDHSIVTQWDDGNTLEPGPWSRPTSSASQPHLVARMLQCLDLRPDHQVLELGTGTGYNTALLSRFVGDTNVTSVEVDQTLAAEAIERLKALDLCPHVVIGDGDDGDAQHAPYDRVIATYAVEHVPPAWITQLRPGGKIVVPVRSALWAGGIWTITRGPQGDAAGMYSGPAAFMSSRSQRFNTADVDMTGAVEESISDLHPSDLEDPNTRFAIGLRVRCTAWDVVEDGHRVLYVEDADTASWAKVIPQPDGVTCLVMQGGERHLWDEITAAWQWWDRMQRPEIQRWVLRIDASGVQRWVPYLST